MEEYREFIKKVFDKLLDKVGIFTLLPALLVFGLSSLFFNISISLSLFIIAFALAGFLELFHVHKKSDINERRQVSYDRNTLFLSFLSNRKKIYYPKIFEEFTYENMSFKLVGFEGVPMPITVTGPSCPRCQKNLLETVSIKFPGRTKIVFKCFCGFFCESKKTEEEIIYELSQFKNLPADDKKAISHS